MAMYFFASRLSSAVCYRRDQWEAEAPAVETPRSQVREPSPVPSTSTAPYSTIRAGAGACCRRPQPVAPPRVPPLPTVSQTVPMVVGGTRTPIDSVTTVPSHPHVKFNNTFPRVARKKVGKCNIFLPFPPSSSGNVALVFLSFSK